MSISTRDTDPDEHYRLLASGRIIDRQRQEAADIHAHKERTKELLDGIARLPRGPGQSPVLKEWAQQMRIAIDEGEEPDWNYRYEPNWRLICCSLQDMEQFGDSGPSGLRELFNFTQLPVAFYQLQSKWKVSQIAKHFKNPREGRRLMLKELLDEIKMTQIPKEQESETPKATLVAWVKSVEPMFVAYLDHEDNWDKIQDFLFQVTKPGYEVLFHWNRGLIPVKILFDKQGRITPDNTPQHLPIKLGLVARPDPHASGQRRHRRFLPSNPFSSHSLGEHHRIGIRQAAMRRLRTLGEARDGGLLLA